MNPIHKPLVPGEPISVSRLIKMGEMARRGQSTRQTAGDIRIVETPNGQRVQDNTPKEWLVEITDKDSSTPIKYGFKEVYQIISTGVYADNPSGLIADGTINYAIAPQDQEYEVGDILYVRYHHADGNIFEVRSQVLSGPSATTNSFDMITEWAFDDTTCTIVASKKRTITGKFTVGAETPV